MYCRSQRLRTSEGNRKLGGTVAEYQRATLKTSPKFRCFSTLDPLGFVYFAPSILERTWKLLFYQLSIIRIIFVLSDFQISRIVLNNSYKYNRLEMIKIFSFLTSIGLSFLRLNRNSEKRYAQGFTNRFDYVHHFERRTAIAAIQPLHNPIPRQASRSPLLLRRKGVNSCRCHNTAIRASIWQPIGRNQGSFFGRASCRSNTANCNQHSCRLFATRQYRTKMLENNISMHDITDCDSNSTQVAIIVRSSRKKTI